MKYFCPSCFGMIDEHELTCPFCHTDINLWEREHGYLQKLVNALRHPVHDVRMAAVTVLAEFRDPTTAGALVDCAFKHPGDVELLKSMMAALNLIPECNEMETAFHRLTYHPSHLVKKSIKHSHNPASKSLK